VLEELASQMQRPDREAIVVASSADGRDEELAERFPWATVVGLPERLLPGRARNQGTALATGDLVAFIDSDAIPSEHWLDELERSLSEFGGFSEDVFPGEDTIFTYPMAQKGRLGYAPRANVRHLNRKLEG